MQSSPSRKSKFIAEPKEAFQAYTVKKRCLLGMPLAALGPVVGLRAGVTSAANPRSGLCRSNGMSLSGNPNCMNFTSNPSVNGAWGCLSSELQN